MVKAKGFGYFEKPIGTRSNNFRQTIRFLARSKFYEPSRESSSLNDLDTTLDTYWADSSLIPDSVIKNIPLWGEVYRPLSIIKINHTVEKILKIRKTLRLLTNT